MVRRPLVAALAAAGLMGISGTASALSVFVDWGPVGSTPSAESSATITVGQTITANYYAAGLPSSGLRAWGLEVDYATPSIFTASNGVLNSADWNGPGGFGSGGVAADPMQASGSVNLLASPVTPVTKDPVLLFSVDYTGASVGSSLFTLQKRPSPFTDFYDGNGNLIDPATITYNTTTLNVTPVPLPAAGWLMMSGLAGLFAMRRRWNGEATDA